MWNTPSQQRLNKIPKLYETENIPLEDKLVHLHFFLGNSDWYAAECTDDTFWGFVILNGDLLNAEWGYFTLRKLDQLNVRNFEVDYDMFWQVRPASAVNKISSAHRWKEQLASAF